MAGNGLGDGEAKAYNLYNRRVYPVQSVNKQDERQVRKQKASRIVMGAVEAFLRNTMCAMVIVECASWENQCEDIGW